MARIIDGSLLKRLRYIYGYSTKTMSHKLNISQPYLSEIENNKKSPSTDIIEKFAKVFGIKKSSLIRMSEEFESSTEEDFIRNLMMGLVNHYEKEGGL